MTSGGWMRTTFPPCPPTPINTPASRAKRRTVAASLVQDENLCNPTSALSVRIDYVLTRGNITATSANRVGHRLEDRTASGLWPSDHAGVWAVVQLKDG